MANVNAHVTAAPIATFGGHANGVSNEGRTAAALAGTAAVVATLSLWAVGAVAAAPIATFGGSATGDMLDGRLGATLAGTGAVAATFSPWRLGSTDGAIATFGGAAVGDVFDGRLAATPAGTASILANVRDVLDGAILAATNGPIATFGGSSVAIIFDGRIGATVAGTGAVTGALSGWRLGAVAAAPIATFGGSSAGILFDGRIAAALAGSGALTGTFSENRTGGVAGGPIATFGGTAAGIITDGVVGGVLPGAIATFGGSATGYSYDVRVRGTGAGRSHLYLGQIDAVAVPSAAAADLYVLTDGFGNPEGAPTTLLIETPDIAPLGELGRLRARLVSLTFQRSAACTVRVTPIVDYYTALPSSSYAYDAPSEPTRATIQIRLLRALTVLRLRIEVVSAGGAIEFYTPLLYYTPLKRHSGMAMGENP